MDTDKISCLLNVSKKKGLGLPTKQTHTHTKKKTLIQDRAIKQVRCPTELKSYVIFPVLNHLLDMLLQNGSYCSRFFLGTQNTYYQYI